MLFCLNIVIDIQLESAYKRNMTRHLLPLLITLTLILSTQSYSLQGVWHIRSRLYQQLRQATQPIVFQFTKIVQKGQINCYLTITACRILVYTYQIQDNQIFLNSKSVGNRDIRNCQGAQIRFIKTQLDQTFFYQIDGKMLTLSSPDMTYQLSLTRFEQRSATPILNGIWTITNGLYFNRIQQNIIVANRTTLGTCGGKSLFSYSYSKQGDAGIQFIPQGKPQCKQYLIDQIPIIKFYRINSIGEKKVVEFFDKDVFLVMEMTSRSSYPAVVPIRFGINGTDQVEGDDLFDFFIDQDAGSSNGVGGSQSQSNGQINGTVKAINASIQVQPTRVVNNVTRQANSSSQNEQPRQTNTTRPTSIVPQPQIQNNVTIRPNTTVSQPQPVRSAQIPVQQPLITQPSQQPIPVQSSQQTVRPDQPTTQTITPSQPITQQPIPTQVPPNPNRTIPITQNIPTTTPSTPFNRSDYRLPLSSQQIQGRWYPLNTRSLPQLSSLPAINDYQIIINSRRIFISGGCNTMFSTYTFAQNTIKDINVVTSSNPCPHSTDQIIRGIIFNTNNRLYVNQKDKTLASISNDRLLMQLGPDSPK